MMDLHAGTVGVVGGMEVEDEEMVGDVVGVEDGGMVVDVGEVE